MEIPFAQDEPTVLDAWEDGAHTEVTPAPGPRPEPPAPAAAPPVPMPSTTREPGGSLVLTRISAFLNRHPGARSQPAEDSARLAEAWQRICELPQTSDIPPYELQAALQTNALWYLSVPRDRLIETAGRTLLVISGQLALGAFARDCLHAVERSQHEAPAGPLARPGRSPGQSPLIRVAARAMTWCLPGDVVRLDALAPLAVPPPEAPALAVFSLTPAVVLAVSSACLDAWQARLDSLRSRVERGTAAVTRRLQQNRDARSEIANMYVRHGMSVATRLRVVDLDRCTFCRECETACAERHGAPRLNIAGKVLGAWGFADTCRTCSDARCVEVCGDDAIHFDEASREVLIDPFKCTGCSLCALSCPYDAIQMHVLDQSPRLVERMHARPSANPLRALPLPKDRYRVADKCDHCVDFGGEQACITACTKHALLERTPLDVFFDRSHQDTLCRPAQPVYAPAERDPHGTELYDPITLMAAPARGQKLGELRLGWLWLVSLVWVLAVCCEILLRFVAPGWSLWALYLTWAQGMSDALAVASIGKRPYAPGGPLALGLGISGTLLLISAFAYSALVRIPALKSRLAGLPARAWIRNLVAALESLGFHGWAGTLGLLLILLHAAGRAISPHPLASLAFWLLVVTVLSGTAARVFASGILALAAQAQLRAAHITARLTALRLQHAGVSQADRVYERFRCRYEDAVPRPARTMTTAAGQPGQPPQRPMAVAWRALGALCVDEATRPLRAWRLRKAFAAICDRKVRAEVARLVSQRALLKRHEVLLPALKPLFAELRHIHIPAAVLLSLAMLAHILMPHW